MVRSPPVSFMVAGISKCGSTTLCNILQDHPDIFIPPVKETNFFVRRDFLAAWPLYESYFAGNEEVLFLGEGSVNYSTVQNDEVVVARILDVYPDMKFIFIVRDPVKRIESAFREFHNSGVVYGINCPFELDQAFKELPAIWEDSCYWRRIQPFRTLAGDESIHVLFLEDLAANPEAELRRCFRFIGADEVVDMPSAMLKMNSGESKLIDTPRLRRMRTSPAWGFKIARLSPEWQDRLFKPLGLRVRFKDKVNWNVASRQWVEEHVIPDAERFLQYYGKLPGFWRYFDRTAAGSR